MGRKKICKSKKPGDYISLHIPKNIDSELLQYINVMYDCGILTQALLKGMALLRYSTTQGISLNNSLSDEKTNLYVQKNEIDEEYLHKSDRGSNIKDLHLEGVPTKNNSSIDNITKMLKLANSFSD